MCWIIEKVKEDGAALEMFCDALQKGDAAEADQLFGECLKRMIRVDL